MSRAERSPGGSRRPPIPRWETTRIFLGTEDSRFQEKDADCVIVARKDMRLKTCSLVTEDFPPIILFAAVGCKFTCRSTGVFKSFCTIAEKLAQLRIQRFVAYQINNSVSSRRSNRRDKTSAEATRHAHVVRILLSLTVSYSTCIPFLQALVMAWVGIVCK
ncbi:PREDICTED: uncharacterized protein LOC105566807 isoform X1 [Vollenhovia emeryi]|uniref:uncharacterized protein LOC105566807 isoform X1 n=1 Tax=Vollenhovia emeryi TaxID=411798 RepID=UPI0005F568E9|nr:PREDICTED: uncharacterized protein LOC105566807 isoform X1 [Vollenhovia emeryi]